MTHKQLHEIARRALAGDVAPIRRMARSGTPGWKAAARRFLEFWDSGVPRYRVFVLGNRKLPYWAFSALPFLTCPGMGQCREVCYSVKAWRCPDAFFRQLQNTILILGRSPHIRAAAEKLDGKLRLYVDGDFDSMRTIAFWMQILRDNPQIKAYGYSKSWEELLEYDDISGSWWPENYVLNLSTGSRHGDELRERVAALPITRGVFLYTNKAKTKAEIMKMFPKAFPCPGKCGPCANGNHACGSMRFKNILIVNPEH
jgi:hypothetical protein